MIDYKKSAELNNTTEDDLKEVFEKYHKSNKRIIAICDHCDLEREVYFSQYHELCKKCVHNTHDAIDAARMKTIEQFSTQEARSASSKRVIQFYKDRPEAREAARLKMLRYYEEHPEAGKEHSDRLKNSAAMKIAIENQIGGNDIVMHHCLYDDADLSKYTLPMTRSEHGMMHARMRSDGYEVQHINSDTDDNGLWGYK